MIKLIGLNKVYGKGSDAVHALRDVSLHVPQGKIFGVIGASGAGRAPLFVASTCWSVPPRARSSSMVRISWP